MRQGRQGSDTSEVSLEYKSAGMKGVRGAVEGLVVDSRNKSRYYLRASITATPIPKGKSPALGGYMNSREPCD